MTNVTPEGSRLPKSSLLILDLSRLLYAVWSRTPTGIPRVELAYAEHLIANERDRLHFAVLDAVGRLRIVDTAAATAFISNIARYWRQDVSSSATYMRIVLHATIIHTILLFRPTGSLSRLVRRHRGRSIYIIPSQLHMERAELVERLKNAGDLKLVYFVHDILPSLLPEYFPAPAERRNRLRMEAAARLADVIVVNSRATAQAFGKRFGKDASAQSIVIAPLGVDSALGKYRRIANSESPYFVMIGTIEPRKNHLMILNIWRALRSEFGDDTPRLILVGSRGWENENVIDMLERSPALRGFVDERNRVADEDVKELLLGARALLLPSFAEGYGLPLAEAFALGIPVLCSDIPALREVGGDVPEFFDPMDGPAWKSAIRDYADPASPRRLAQLQRLANWKAPSWDEHFAIVSSMLTTLEDEDR